MRLSAKSFAKRIAFAALGSAPVVKWRLSQAWGSSRLTILSFHRVAPNDRSSYPPLEPRLFDEAMAFCRKHFTILTFGDLGDFKPATKPPLIVSFDDGYRDFIEYSVPILRRHGVRCNHNIIPACVQSGLPPLNVHAQDYVGRAPRSLLAKLAVPGFGPIDPERDREALGRRISAYLKAKPIAEQKRLAAELISQFREFEGFSPTAMMTLDDIRSIADEHELGAHSFEHASLDVESDDYVRKDARACRSWFRDELRLTTDIYALPNGAARSDTSEILKAEGFRHILLTGEHYSRLSTDEHPRFTMDGSSRAEIRYRATGFVRH
jgi:peptidoglycan/xylan/chitin deacetylase (PgdA/CDA1 family)